jgi:hypothetical protein
MKKSNHYWVGYDREGNILTVKVEDTTGRKLDQWSAKMNDPKATGKIMKILHDKYSFTPEVSFDNSPNAKKDDDDELKWLLGQS